MRWSGEEEPIDKCDLTDIRPANQNNFPMVPEQNIFIKSA